MFTFAGNVLLVDYALVSNIAGVRYNTIQAAIDYVANSGAATGLNRWKIFITPHKNNANYVGYNEAITLTKHCDLIGLARVMLKVTFAYSGSWTGGQYVKMQNLFVKPDVDGSIFLRGIEANDCSFNIEADNATPLIAQYNSQFTRCGFMIKGRPDATILSNGDNRYIQCYSNETPWKTPREISEDELARKIVEAIHGVEDFGKCIFNFHCPPKDSTLDTCPMLDTSTDPPTVIMEAGNPVLFGAGSTSVRAAINKYQPVLALHGHIHESRGIARLGKTVCINPGSEYGEGILHGVIVNISDGKIEGYQLTSG